MSDEVAAPVAAPASAAAPAPIPVATPATAPIESAAVPTSPTSAPIDWDSWNGEVAHLPTEYHSLAEGMGGWYQKQHDSNLSDIEDLRSVYTAMLNDEDDPRLAKLAKQLEDAQVGWDADKQQVSHHQSEYQKLLDLTVHDYVERFWEDHADLKEDKAVLAQFSSLIADNEKHGGPWEGYAAAALLKLPQEAQRVAIGAKADGVSDEYALKLGSAHAQVSGVEASVEEARKEAAKQLKAEATKPRPAAKITNGAIGTSRPNMAEKTMSGAKTLDEMRNLAAARALRVHSGGKR